MPAATFVGNNLELVAPVELQAAAGKPARVSILAYSGGAMYVSGYGQVAISLSGLALPASVPILADHDASLSGVAGSGSPRVKAGRLYVEGSLVTSSAGNQVRDLAAEFVPLQASVGVDVESTRFVRAGEKVRVNGREIKAGPRGLTLVEAGQLREVSILPLGADSQTHVAVTAKKGPSMPRTRIVDTEDPTTEAPPDPIQAERDRIKAVRAVFNGEYRDLEAQAIEEGWSVEDARDAALQRLRASRANGAAAAGIAFSRGESRVSADPKTMLVASAMLMAGHGEAVARHLPDGERLANSLQRPNGWPELCAMALRGAGLPVPHDRNELLRAGFSTVNMPVALGESIEKLALDPFLEASSNWRAVGRIASCSDFKDNKAIRLNVNSRFEKVGPGGELKHVNLSEDAYEFNVDTYGEMVMLTRQDIINDDASILNDIPMVLGNDAARKVADVFFTALVGNAGSFFSTGKKNLLTDALGMVSLGEAINKLRTMKDADGRILGLVPTTLMVPSALELTARSLLFSEGVQRDQSADNQPTMNPLANLKLGLVVEPRLDATSTVDWYLFSQPRQSAVIVAFLQGKQVPTVESIQPEPHVLGAGWRCYLDFGVSLAEPKAAIKSDVSS